VIVKQLLLDIKHMCATLQHKEGHGAVDLSSGIRITPLCLDMSQCGCQLAVQRGGAGDQNNFTSNTDSDETSLPSNTDCDETSVVVDMTVADTSVDTVRGQTDIDLSVGIAIEKQDEPH